MNKVVVIDTNVLLADPNSLLSFPRAEVVIPETVLGELDKLKTARVDPDLRFRGREVSRLLFEFSEEGSLVEGVELPEGGRLRVVPFESDTPMPEGLIARNSDDRILATAVNEREKASNDTSVVLVTNDLNMLLKAQTLGVEVQRHGDGTEGGWGRRYIIRPFQRYKVPISILAIALAVFAAVIAIVVFSRPSSTSVASLPTEFRNLLSDQQEQALDALTTLQSRPEDPESLLQMGNVYFDQAEQAQSAGDRASQIRLAQQGVRYYERYLKLRPDDNGARADLASLLFYTGQTDKAIQEAGKVLQNDPEHVNANYNLGIIYWRGQRDLQAAADQMRTVIRITQGDANQAGVNHNARALLDQIAAEAKAAGQSIETTEGVLQ